MSTGTTSVQTGPATPSGSGGIARIRSAIANRLSAGLHARHRAYGLVRDLDIPLETPRARIPISIRPLEPADIPVLFSLDQPGLDQKERLEIIWRQKFLESGFPGCFVAIDERAGTPCYFQWLLGAAENDRLAPLKQFPALGRNEALLENAYTPIAYRAKGIMPAAMAMIAERARDFGASRVITFVGEENMPSMKGCRKAGFAPYLLREQTSFGFGTFRAVRFTPLAADDPRREFNF
ncbi:GNAT family N-acetyltransferase [Arsenicitalea aurantiaca]|uniref:GNAT family N-acetyltransferase n=1 Tax=Arsenicitalea aurantiaca TaxID=1783274 RepID=A0A433XKL7_9HYPH|nr:GNAT family N-acetyltransferase [Arsenicitalea aurantiaca]RUT34593.1 GNAT family N-acetyltransferase [Arsenicitalea aurantiaca]